jgi:hypothetical protein
MRVIKLLVWSLGMVQRCWGYTYEQGGLRVRVGEVRGGKETDRCPLTNSADFITTKIDTLQLPLPALG